MFVLVCDEQVYMVFLFGSSNMAHLSGENDAVKEHVFAPKDA